MVDPVQREPLKDILMRAGEHQPTAKPSYPPPPIRQLSILDALESFQQELKAADQDLEQFMDRFNDRLNKLRSKFGGGYAPTNS